MGRRNVLLHPSAHGVRVRLLEEFHSKGLRAGDGIESIRTIAKRLKIRKSVAEKAIRSLIADGICTAQHGRGVFLAVDEPGEARTSALVGIVSGYAKYSVEQSPIFREIFDGLERWIIGEGHNVLTLQHWGSKPAAQKAREVDQFADRLSGLVAVGIYNDADCILLRNTGLPLVVADYDTVSLGTDCVVTDNSGAARLLAEAVVKRGAQRVFHLQRWRPTHTDPASAQRLEELRQCLGAANRPLVGPVHMRDGDNTPHLVPVAEAIGRDGGRAAVICDEAAELEAVPILGRLGVVPGRDFLLGYFGPQPAPQEKPAWPALVAAFDFEDMGNQAAMLFDKRMEAGPGRPERITVSSRIQELVPDGTNRAEESCQAK